MATTDGERKINFHLKMLSKLKIVFFSLTSTVMYCIIFIINIFVHLNNFTLLLNLIIIDSNKQKCENFQNTYDGQNDRFLP